MDKSYSKQLIKTVISFLIPSIIILLPAEFIPIANITLAQQRVLAIFFLAALLWILEPLPNYTTSVIVILLELVLVSDKGLIWLREQDNIGTLLKYQDIFAAFSAPIIILFIGGFSLALASQKYKVDFTIANILLKPFGSNPKMILLGLMLITALFSMFMSNTATTAMLLSILTPVLLTLPESDNLKSGFVLAIPFAANIGGIGTPIGTPPNAIALSALPEHLRFSFSEWMMFAVPYVIILLIITWVIILITFPSKTKHIKVNIDFEKNKDPNTDPKKDPKRYIVYGTFLLTIILWMTDFLHSMNSYIVAMVPLGIFFTSGILKKEDLRMFNWEVLWLVAGGIAIGFAMQETGLAKSIVNQIAFDNVSALTIIVIATGITYLLSNFLSHTAASNLLFPLLVAIATHTPSIVDNDLVIVVILCAVFASSLSMILPISTPPNALGYSTGLISTKMMLSLGLIIGLIGIFIAFFYFRVFGLLGII